MIKLSALAIALCSLTLPLSAMAVKSPDGKLAVEFTLTADGAPRYAVSQSDRIVLKDSSLGLVRDDADFTRGLVPAGPSVPETVTDRYELLTSKRRENTYKANRQVFHLATTAGKKIDIIFQVSNDGVAFRYYFPEASAEVRTLTADASSFHFQPGTTAWLQAMQGAKTGWKKTNPAYEEYYQKEIPVGTPSPLGKGWIYPALFRNGDTWFAVSEGSLPRTWCATHLSHASTDGNYGVSFADALETINSQSVNPASTLPWFSPWRFITIGSLKTVTESTLGTDLADAAAVKLPPGSVKPGKAAWSWPLLGDRSANFDTQKQFIDYAADMGWAYCLIDALWDTQIGYEKMKVLADYAASKHVALLLWYNSNGNWNEAPQTPKHKLLTHESRIAEFTRLQAIGIKGLKVDFFGGDGRPVIALYHDLLEDAAPFGLLMNFHGTTLPRGWQRTYPHLMTAEAIKGLEYITFDQRAADQEATHAAMLPFTRNLFDPMDFTPMVLDRISPKITRRTTSAFELALAVLFTSGIQHYGEIPAGMAKMPAYVKDFVKSVPAVWDDVRFIDGYPGKFVVIARRAGTRWFIAGINAESAEKHLTLDLGALNAKNGGSLITEGEGAPFQQRMLTRADAQTVEITLKPSGGFVLTLD